MITKTITLADRRVNMAAIKIGNENDNNAERIKFVLPARLAGATVFLHLHIGDYVDIVRLDDERIYTPTRTHTQYPGKWEAYIEAMQDGDVVWHSDPFALHVGDLPGDGKQIEQAYPTAIEEALRAADMVTGLEAEAETLPAGSDATVRTEEDEDGNRKLVFGIPRGEGEGGAGNDGFSPTVEVEKINGGNHVTITDAEGEKSFDVMDGEKGDAFEYEDFTAEQLENLKGEKGEPFTYEDFTDEQLNALKGKDGYTPQKGVDYFDGQDGYTPRKGVDYFDGEDGYTPVKGKDYFDGKDGQPGADGFSPTVDVTPITGGHRVTVTDKNGAKPFDVLNGKDGAGGEGSGAAIIDVAVLPTEDIREDVFYRVLSTDFYYNLNPQTNYVCEVVETLPEVGEPATDATLSTIHAYYAIDTGEASGYLPAQLAGAFGLPAGWYPVELLFQAAGWEYGGIVNSLAAMTEDEAFYILLQPSVKYRNDGVWKDVQGIGWRGTGHAAEVFNSPVNVASGPNSHAEGWLSVATGYASHAEGESEANGDYSHAEGYSEANGDYSHAEGQGRAIGDLSHAEGQGRANVDYSHAEGESEANGDYSHAEGRSTIARGRSQHVQGELNSPDPDASGPYSRGKYAHIVGNGIDTTLSNAHTLDWDGNAWFAGDVYVGGKSQDDPNAEKLLKESAVVQEAGQSTTSVMSQKAVTDLVADALGGGGGATTWDDLGSAWGNGTVLAENTPIWVEDSGMFGIYETVHVMAAGYEYTVSWNGAEYACLAEDYYEEDVHMGWMLGNTSVLGGTQENENPFVLVLVAEATDDGLYGFAVPLDGTTTLTLSVTGYTEIITPVPAKYLGEVRGQQKIVIDVDNSYAIVPFDMAWAMDMGELQSAITVIYNGTEHSVVGLSREEYSENGMELKSINILFAQPREPASGYDAIMMYAASWRSIDGVTEIVMNNDEKYVLPVHLQTYYENRIYCFVRQTGHGDGTYRWVDLAERLPLYALSSIQLKSPSGNIFKVAVDDNGVLTATQV